MPSYIVKLKPDEDMYVYYSTIVDAPTAWGDRNELERVLRARGEYEPERFDRADATGTSSMLGDFTWDEDDFLIANGGPPIPEDWPLGWWHCKRADLAKWCETDDPALLTYKKDAEP